MLFKAKLLHIICILATLFGAPRLTVSNPAVVQQFDNGMESFGARLYTQLVKERPKQNIVFSPFSIHTCLTMARLGAEGETALEMDNGLALPARRTEDLAKSYHALLEQYENSSILKMVNKIYAMAGYSLRDQFNELLTKKFYSSVESLNFADNEAAANAINTWVEKKTNNSITDLIDPNLLNEDTRLVLVNAIHFKGNWVHPFKKFVTRETDFYLDSVRTTKVQMMITVGYFKYADLPDLDATALEMPYANSDLAMLIILPNEPTGLAELENRLQNTSLADITHRMYSRKVIVNMHKFKAEFQVELTKSFQEMGMGRMFTDNAEFGKMLKSSEGLKISTIVHKAFIEVNEEGTEAAAATHATGIVPLSAVIYEEPAIVFQADRPFYYVVKNTNNLELFKGKIKDNL